MRKSTGLSFMRCETGASNSSILDFVPYGYDERQYCSPGFNLPVGALMRTPNGQYPEYHTSADDLNLVDAGSLGESLAMLLRVVYMLESNRVCRNLFPKGEPQLGRRGLYRSMGGVKDSPQQEMAILWVLNLSDGDHDLLQIAERARLDFRVVTGAAERLIAHGLLASEGVQRSSPGLDQDVGPIALWTLLKYWNGPRVEAEGVDGEERARRIPTVGCNERATRPAAPSASRPQGCADFGAGRRCSLGRDRSGYRRCARASASAKIDSNAGHSSISTVSSTMRMSRSKQPQPENGGLPRGIAVVTGAGSGIGRAIVLELAKSGVACCLVGRTLSKLEEVAHLTASAGVRSSRSSLTLVTWAPWQPSSNGFAHQAGASTRLVHSAATMTVSAGRGFDGGGIQQTDDGERSRPLLRTHKATAAGTLREQRTDRLR